MSRSIEGGIGFSNRSSCRKPPRDEIAVDHELPRGPLAAFPACGNSARVDRKTALDAALLCVNPVVWRFITVPSVPHGIDELAPK